MKNVNPIWLRGVGLNDDGTDIVMTYDATITVFEAKVIMHAINRTLGILEKQIRGQSLEFREEESKQATELKEHVIFDMTDIEANRNWEKK